MTFARLFRSAVIVALILYTVQGIRESFNPMQWPSRDVFVLLSAWGIYLAILTGESWRRRRHQR
jgi:hypothetical protein